MIVPRPVMIQARAIQLSARVKVRIALRRSRERRLAVGIIGPGGDDARAVGHRNGRA